MNDSEKEIWRNLDLHAYGSNEAIALKDKALLMKRQLAAEQSSLGRYLESLRRRLDFSLPEMAKDVGVELAVWKDWEMDFLTPTCEELDFVVRRLGLRAYEQGILDRLWGEASRFRLRRMTHYRGEFMAARGVASESGIAWNSVDEDTQVRIQAWGSANGYDFPRDLLDFLNTLGSEEEKEAWVDEILEG